LEDIRCQLSLCTSAKETAEQILKQKGDVRLKTIFIMNNWWHERNAVREGELRRSADHIAILSGRQTLELTEMGSPGLETATRQGRQRWQRPHQGMLKMNVDGSFKCQDACGGWGYVIRDDLGAIIQSGWGRKDFACSPLHMELLACLQGLSAAVQLGIQYLELETDAKQVVDAIKGNDFRLSLVGGLVHEVKELLAENFTQALVLYAPT